MGAAGRLASPGAVSSAGCWVKPTDRDRRRVSGSVRTRRALSSSPGEDLDAERAVGAGARSNALTRIFRAEQAAEARPSTLVMRTTAQLRYGLPVHRAPCVATKSLRWHRGMCVLLFRTAATHPTHSAPRRRASIGPGLARRRRAPARCPAKPTDPCRLPILGKAEATAVRFPVGCSAAERERRSTPVFHEKHSGTPRGAP